MPDPNVERGDRSVNDASLRCDVKASRAGYTTGFLAYAGYGRSTERGKTMERMNAMLLRAKGRPLEPAEVAMPRPRPSEVRVRVLACGVCRTDLHVLDGDLAEPRLPLILGHEIVGRIVELGAGALGLSIGDRVGIPWLGSTCGHCAFCARGAENLCDDARFTGYQRDGGYAEYAVADARFCFPLPPGIDDVHAAPLLCAGLIGHRTLRMAGEAERIGIYGFGAAAHIVAQEARFLGQEVYAFTRPGDLEAHRFALSLGCTWAGGSDEAPPKHLDAALIFAPVGPLIPVALGNLRKGGVVVCGGIHMSDIPSFPYSLLWGERVIRSVANLTRRDGEELLALAPRVPLRTEVEVFALAEANEALARLREGHLTGAAVLVPEAQRAAS